MQCLHTFYMEAAFFWFTQLLLHVLILSGPIINHFLAGTRYADPLSIQLLIIYYAACDTWMIQSTSWNSKDY